MSYRSPGQEELETRVGGARPRLRRVWKEKNLFHRFVALLEHSARWFFFLFNNVALFRFVCEAIVLGALAVAVIGVWGEFQQRKVDRAVRIATLFSQIAQTHALKYGKGLWALPAGVEALARENVPMRGINLSGVKLTGMAFDGALYTFPGNGRTPERSLER